MSTSQPSPSSPLQFAQPDLQSILQRPAWQVGLAGIAFGAVVGHTFPQPPQLFGSVRSAVSQSGVSIPVGQRPQPGAQGYAQTPSMHPGTTLERSVSHALEQDPQERTSDLTLTHSARSGSPQHVAVSPAQDVPAPQRHRPSVQRSATLPHEAHPGPQWSTSAEGVPPPHGWNRPFTQALTPARQAESFGTLQGTDSPAEHSDTDSANMRSAVLSSASCTAMRRFSASAAAPGVPDSRPVRSSIRSQSSAGCLSAIAHVSGGVPPLAASCCR